MFSKTVKASEIISIMIAKVKQSSYAISIYIDH